MFQCKDIKAMKLKDISNFLLFCENMHVYLIELKVHVFDRKQLLFISVESIRNAHSVHLLIAL